MDRFQCLDKPLPGQIPSRTPQPFHKDLCVYVTFQAHKIWFVLRIIPFEEIAVLPCSQQQVSRLRGFGRGNHLTDKNTLTLPAKLPRQFVTPNKRNIVE